MWEIVLPWSELRRNLDSRNLGLHLNRYRGRRSDFGPGHHSGRNDRCLNPLLKDRSRLLSARGDDGKEQRQQHEGTPTHPARPGEEGGGLAPAEDTLGRRYAATHGREPPTLPRLEEDDESQEDPDQNEQSQQETVHGQWFGFGGRFSMKKSPGASMVSTRSTRLDDDPGKGGRVKGSPSHQNSVHIGRG